MTSRPALFIIGFLVLLGIALKSPMLFLLSMLVVLVAGASAVWERYCLAGVTYVRRFGAQRLFCGEETDLWVEIVNAKPLPLAWLKTEDEFPNELTIHKAKHKPSGQPHRRLLTNLLSVRWYERVRRHYRMTADRRGVFDFGPAAVSSGDIFGFRTRRQEIDHRHTVLVYPKVAPMDRLDLRAARPLGDFGAQRRIADDPLRLAGTREYQPGDSVRHIHWKATARSGSLQTKLFDPSASHQVVICLNNQTLERAYGGVIVDQLETAIVAAASIAHAALEARHPVGLVSNGTLRHTAGLAELSASRRSDQAMHILEMLAQITYFTATPFEQLLRAEASQFPYGATLIVVTTFVTEAILTELLTLRSAGHPVAIVIVAPRQSASDIPVELPAYYLTRNWTDLETLKPG